MRLLTYQNLSGGDKEAIATAAAHKVRCVRINNEALVTVAELARG
ncbi:hypothetical protein [Scytonema sp. UIC 10036]|nr:hypothetical protein [Scytonema sp. UIC 10036]